MSTKTTLSILFLLLSLPLGAAVVSRIYTFTDGSILTASQLNSEFNNIIDNINSLDNANLSSTANIAPSKINGTIAGDGLGRDSTTGILETNVDDIGIEVSGDTLQLKDLGVVTAKINDLAVTTAKINDLGVTTAKINDLGVTTGKLAASAVTETKIANAAVTEFKIGTGAVTNTKIGAAAVSFDKLYARPVGTSVAEGGVAVSAGSASFSTTINTDVTNLSVTLVVSSSARPVMLMLMQSDTASTSNSGVGCSRASTSCSASFSFRRAGSAFGSSPTVETSATGASAVNIQVPCSSFMAIDTAPTAGSTIYAFSTVNGPAGTALVTNCKLVAYEL